MSTVQDSAHGVTASPAKPTLRECADALAPRTAERAYEVDERRDVHADSIAEMQEAGLFRAFVPLARSGLRRSRTTSPGAVIEMGNA